MEFRTKAVVGQSYDKMFFCPIAENGSNWSKINQNGNFLTHPKRQSPIHVDE